MRGPSRQRSAKGSALRARARSSTARCSAAVRSSSARKWRRVIGRPSEVVAGGGRVEQPGQGVDEQVELGGGDDERGREPDGVRGDRVDDEAGVAGQGGDRGRVVAGQGDGLQQAGAADAGDQRVAEVADALLEVLAGLAGVVEQAFGGDGVEHGEPGGAGERVAAEGRAVHPRGEHRADLGAEGDERADRHAAAEALGQRHRVGHDARLVEGEPRAGAADAGLHLVEHEQRAGLAGEVAGRAQVVPSRRAAPRPRPGSARAPRAEVCSVTAARRASTSPHGTCVTPGMSGSNGSR